MKIGIVGIGYWGPNLVRNFYSQKEVERIIACDYDEDRLDFIKMRYPQIGLTSRYEDLLASDVDAIIIATPVRTHYQLAKEALLAGKHIWVEKPFTANSKQANDLISLAKENNLRLFVDHTFLYTGAVKKIKEIVSNGELGDIIYFDSVRINLGLFQHDVNVIWDLTPHDLSIMSHIIPDKTVSSLTACGVSNFNEQENIAQLSLNFRDDNCFAHFHVNWTSPVKIRKMILAGNKKMLVFDDMENSEKIKVYDCGVEVNTKESIHKMLVEYRTGDMYSPKVMQTEALSLGAKEFINSINENREPFTNGEDGLKVVKILEAAEFSIKNQGVNVKFDYEPENNFKRNITIKRKPVYKSKREKIAL